MGLGSEDTCWKVEGGQFTSIDPAIVHSQNGEMRYVKIKWAKNKYFEWI